MRPALPLDEARAPELDPATHFLGEPEDTLAYLVHSRRDQFRLGVFSEAAEARRDVRVFHGGGV